MQELFTGHVVCGPLGSVTVVSVDECQGEARVSCRKGRLIFLWEWRIALAWRGSLAGGGLVQGRLLIPSVEQEQELGEVEVEVSQGQEGRVLGQMLGQGRGKEELLQPLVLYSALLREEYSEGSLLPGKDGSPVSPKSMPVKTPSLAKAPGPGPAASMRGPAPVSPPKVSCQRPRKRPAGGGHSGQSDLLFYLSLVSLVGVSAGLVVRVARAWA